MKSKKLSIWILLGLMSAASVANSQEENKKVLQRAEPVVQKPAGINEKLLDEAEVLVKSGKPADAYALLEPFEFEHAGEERFDYLIGVAALDSGKSDRATLALERVLMVNPDFAAARLDLARAYYQLGDLPRAQTEFEAVLTQKPSETARANIGKYLDEIGAQLAGKQIRVTGYIEGALGHDSNANASTGQSRIFVDVLATNILLDPASVKTSDNYYGVAAGGEITRRLNSDWGLYVGADVRQRGYNMQKSFDSLGLEARVGMLYGAQANRFRFGALGGQYNLGNSHNSDTTGLGAEWSHVLSPSNQLKIFGQYAQYRFVDLVMQPNDYDQQVVGGGWMHVLANGKATLFGSLYWGAEKDVSKIITLPATPNGGRTDGARSFSGLRIGGQSTLSDNMTLFANAGWQIGDYSKINPLFLRQRNDRQHDFALGANWHCDKLWTLRPQLNYAKNESNIVIYGYDRTDISLSIRRDFR